MDCRRVVPLLVVGLVCVLALVSRFAAAEPVLRLPAAGNGVITGGGANQRAVIALLGEANGMAILGAERLTEFPEVDGIKGNEPELSIARFGLLGRLERWPVSGLLRIDFSEGLRVDDEDVTDRPLAVMDRFVDDASVWWEPRVWAAFVLGRGKVPFSRFRQLDRMLLTAGATPFVVDRITPDRRWGATVLGDLGALGYAAGVYVDTARLERRRGADDPSQAGRAILAAHVEWTPRAPIGSDHIATASSDPWHDTVRVSVGVGSLVRLRADNAGTRLDTSLSGQVTWRRYSSMGELIVTSDGGAVSLSGAAQASMLASDKVLVFGRGDADVVVDLWTLGGGVSYFVTPDRRNKLTLFGWVRRDSERGPRRDGVVVQLQAGF